MPTNEEIKEAQRMVYIVQSSEYLSEVDKALLVFAAAYRELLSRAESAEDVRFGEKPHEWPVTHQYHTVSARVTIERPVVKARPISPHNLATVRGISQGRSAKIDSVFSLSRLAPGRFHKLCRRNR